MGERWAGSSWVSQAAHTWAKMPCVDGIDSSKEEETTAKGDVCHYNKEQRNEDQVEGGLWWRPALHLPSLLKMLLNPGFLVLSFEVTSATSLPFLVQFKRFAAISSNYIQDPDTTSSISGHTLLSDISIPSCLTLGLRAKFHTVMELSWESSCLAEGHMKEESFLPLEAFSCLSGAHTV